MPVTTDSALQKGTSTKNVLLIKHTAMDYKKHFEAIKKLTPQKRGTEFEKLINKIFEDIGILETARFRTPNSQQEIDGAIKIFNRIFLLEVKWEREETLAASKLYSFLGKINSKIDGTLGLFISYNELKSNFIDGFRNGLKQNCILIHGENNIMDIIEQKVDIQRYIEYCYIQASTKGKVFVDTAEYILIPQKDDRHPSAQEENNKKWAIIFNSLTGSDSLSTFTALLEANYSAELELSMKILNVYNTLTLDTLVKEKLGKLFEKLINDEKPALTKYLIQKLKSDYWQDFSDEFLTEVVKKGDLNIELADRKIIASNVVQVLNGDWNQENNASNVIDIFYHRLTDDEKIILANKYLDLYCDRNRMERFQQKIIAKRLFNDLKELYGNYFDKIKDELIEKIKIEKATEYLVYNDEEERDVKKRFTVKSIFAKYHKVFSDNGMNTPEFIEAEYDKI